MTDIEKVAKWLWDFKRYNKFFRDGGYRPWEELPLSVREYWLIQADAIMALLGDGEPVGYVDKAEMELLTADLTPTVHLWRYPGDEEDGVPVYLAPQQNHEAKIELALHKCSGLEVIKDIETGTFSVYLGGEDPIFSAVSMIEGLAGAADFILGETDND